MEEFMIFMSLSFIFLFFFLFFAFSSGHFKISKFPSHTHKLSTFSLPPKERRNEKGKKEREWDHVIFGKALPSPLLKPCPPQSGVLWCNLKLLSFLFILDDVLSVYSASQSASQPERRKGGKKRGGEVSWGEAMWGEVTQFHSDPTPSTFPLRLTTSLSAENSVVDGYWQDSSDFMLQQS